MPVKQLVLLLVFIAGALKSFILPVANLIVPGLLPFIRVPPWVGLDFRLIVPITLFGVVPMMGATYFLLKRQAFRAREGRNWAAWLGLVFAAVTMAAFAVDGLFKALTPWEALYFVSETPFYGVSLGLLMYFYEMEEEKLFLAFLLPMGVIWLLYPLGIMAAMAGVVTPGLPAYEACFWLDPWFWGDQIFNVGWGVYVTWAFLRRLRS